MESVDSIKNKIMKKLLLLLVFTYISCGIPYDGETIINIKLKVVNSENQPLANEKAYIGTSRLRSRRHSEYRSGPYRAEIRLGSHTGGR